VPMKSYSMIPEKRNHHHLFRLLIISTIIITIFSSQST